jgi:DNA-directed RNA polymerase specialized sigma subunit
MAVQERNQGQQAYRVNESYGTTERPANGFVKNDSLRKSSQGGKSETSYSRGILKTKLTKYEQWLIGKLYKEHEGLRKHVGKKLILQFPHVQATEIFSCLNIAFIKAARTWNPSRGKFSVVLFNFAFGEVKHYLRTNAYWGYKVDTKTRMLGMEARKLIAFRKVPMFALPRILGCTKEELDEALKATLQMAYSYTPESFAGEASEAEDDLPDGTFNLSSN